MERSERGRAGSTVRRALLVLLMLALLVLPAQARASSGSVANYSAFSPAQQATLMSIARDTWNFYSTDIDSATHLPMDNVTFAGGSTAPTGYGRYTSAANIGVYLWAVVAASDLGLITHAQAVAQLQPTLQELHNLNRYRGFLYQWYSTTTGEVTADTNGTSCAGKSPTPAFTDPYRLCLQISQVDNGWYASGLIVVRSALPELRNQVDSLLAPMDFGIFYDNGPETACNVYYDPNNPNGPYQNQPTGQMFGLYFVGFPPTDPAHQNYYYHNGALYSDPRITAYIGMGLHQMPGNVWWRSWRILPPKAPYDNCQATDPDFSWTGQGPGTGYWQNYQDPQSGQTFHVWEGHYTYPDDSNLTFVPTWAGGMFEGQMVNQVVPETSWGTHSFGLNDLRWAQVQMTYATEKLGYPVWGMSPSSTPDDTGNYDSYGATGLAWPYSAKEGLSQCFACGASGPSGSVMEDTVTPHTSFLALDVLPQQAFSNIQALQAMPGLYGPEGFFDAVAMKDFTYTQYPNNVATNYSVQAGEVGHRILVLDQSMIMAALDNALENRAMQRHFAADPASWAAQTYLSMETMSIH